jgi:hypothetical protein
MVNESIIFLCPACETKLTVPWEMAGVLGPCPICRVEIQAPYPVSKEPQFSEPIDHASPVAEPQAVEEVEQVTVLEVEQDTMEDVEPQRVAEVEPIVEAEIQPPIQTVPEIPAIQQPLQSIFPKSPPPYQPGLGLPSTPEVDLIPLERPIFDPARVELPPLDEIAKDELPISRSQQELVSEEDISLLAVSLPPGSRRLPPTKTSSDTLAPEITPRPPLPPTVRTHGENIRQIALNRGPTTVYPDPKRPLGSLDQNEVGDDLITNPNDLTGRKVAANIAGKRHLDRKKPLLKILVVSLFLALLGATILVLWNLQARQTREKTIKLAASKVAFPVIKPVDLVPATPSQIPAEPSTPILVKPNVEPPVIEEAKPELSTPERAAMQVLEKFLAATSLAERMPLIETKTQEKDLETSCLTSSLPKTGKIVIEVSENDPAKQMVDYYYHVTFDGVSTGSASVTILVRTRGAGVPKVIVDPFLDSYGGRLAAYASKPSEKVSTFQVIIWPLAACYDTNIPDRNEKLTFKLLAKDDTKEIALAYLGKQSEVAKMLEDDSHRLSYGKAQVCTVTLGWNTVERQETPYLEVLELKTFNWDP